MPTIYDLKPRFQARLRPLADSLAKAGVTANGVTVAALALSLAHGAWLALAPDSRWPFLVLPVTLFLRMALNAIDGVECLNIEGAFYLFPRFPNSTKSSAELAEALIDKAGIASVPGGAFGKSGEGHVRFTIATAMSDLEKAVDKLAKAAQEL